MRTALYTAGVFFIGAFCLVTGINILANVSLGISWFPVVDTVIGIVAIVVGIGDYAWGTWWLSRR